MATIKVLVSRLLLVTLLVLTPVAALARGTSVRAPSSRGSSSSYQRSVPITRGGSAPRTSSSLGSSPQTINSSYHPSFGGYKPPYGSRVFSPGFSITDLLLFTYLFNHNGNQQVIVQQPDGHQVTTQTSAVDVMYYVDLGILLILGFGIIGVIVYFVNKWTQPPASSQGSLYASH